MSDDTPTPPEEQYAAWLAARDALLAGDQTVPDPGVVVPPEWQQRLDGDLPCLRLLRDVLAPGPSPVPSAAALPSGTRLGRFELRRELGRGSYGLVHLAHDPQLRRDVALKVPRPETLADPAARHRFLQESHAAARLDHPNVVSVYEVGEAGPFCFIASAYCPGSNLAAWLRSRSEPVAVRLAADLVATLAEAVEHAHGRGVLHRDLKPGNVLLEVADNDAGFIPKVTDFGLAKLLGTEDVAQTQTMTVMGTPCYMAPEQAAGRSRDVGPPADVYSLGVILYEVLTGRPPFVDESMEGLLEQVRTQEPVPPGRLRPRLPRDLDTICLKCLQKEPGRRYASAQALADDLRRFLADRPILARPTSTAERAWRWCRRNPALAVSSAAAAVLLVVALLASSVGYWRVSVAQADADAKRVLAEQNEQQAKRLGAAEASQRRLAEERLVRLTLGNGLRLIEEGDLLGSLPWLVEALRLQENDPERAEMHRVRLAAVLQQCPRLAQLWVHDGPVRHAEFSPDGRRVVTASADGTARVWNVADGKEACPPVAHGPPVAFAAFSPDGRRLVTLGMGAAKVWNATGTVLYSSLGVGYTGREQAAFSADGQRLLTAGPGAARLFDLKTSQLIRDFPAPFADHIVYRAVFSPDGRRALLSTHTACVYDVETGQRTFTLPVPVPGRISGAPQMTAFSPDGRRVVTSEYTGQPFAVRVWDVVTGKEVCPPLKHTEMAGYVEFSPDGGRVVTAGHGPAARVWDVNTGKEVCAIRHGGSFTLQASFSPDGRRLVTVGIDGAVRVWDAATGHPFAPPLKHNARVNRATFSPDGHFLLTASDDHTVRLWDLDTRPAGCRLFEPRGGGGIRGTCFDGTDPCVLVGVGKSLRLWNPATGKEAGPPLPSDDDLSWGLSNSSPLAVTVSRKDSTLQVWDARTGKAVGHRKSLRKLADVYFSPDNRLAAATDQGRDPDTSTMCVWDVAKGTEVCPPLRGAWIPQSMSAAQWPSLFSPDGRRLLTRVTSVSGKSFTTSFTVWDLATGEAACPPLQDRSATSAALSSDGRYVVTIDKETARIWNATTGQETCPPLKHTAAVTVVAFSPDGHRLLTGCEDGTARVWAWDAGAVGPVTPVFKHGPRVSIAAFSPDGRRVMTADSFRMREWGHTARVWDAATGAAVTPPLDLSPEVQHASFSADGRSVLLSCWQRALVCSLQPEGRSVADLQRLAGLLAGQQIAANGEPAPVAADALAEAFRRRADPPSPQGH
jgi:WD40 repeat protein